MRKSRRHSHERDFVLPLLSLGDLTTHYGLDRSCKTDRHSRKLVRLECTERNVHERGGSHSSFFFSLVMKVIVRGRSYGLNFSLLIEAKGERRRRREKRRRESTRLSLFQVIGDQDMQRFC